MRVTILGSGTFLPDAARGSAAHHLETPDASVLLDCGTGALHGLARRGIDWRGLTHVGISHYHSDHVGDLSALLFALRHGLPDGRTRPLVLFGPPGFRDFLGRLAAAHGRHVHDPGIPTSVREIQQGVPLLEYGQDLRVDAHPTPHTEESVAYRVTCSGASVGYTGDTGPSAELGAFFSGCGLLISECAWSDAGQGPIHLAPEGVADLARAARPALLALTHVYPPQTPAAAARRVEALWKGRVIAAEDGTRIVGDGRRWAVDPTPGPM